MPKIVSKRNQSPLRMKGGGITDAVISQVGTATSLVGPIVSETFRLLPDGIIFGSAFFALLSQSYPMAVFVGTMLEASLVGIGLQKMMTFMDLGRTLPTITDEPGKCYPSTFAPSLETLMTLQRDTLSSAFPSFPIFFLSTASAYVVGAMWSMKRELEALGSDYAARFYISIIISTLLLFATMSYRLAFGCDGVGILILSLFIGLVLGGLLSYQNIYLFGRDAVNFAGIPLLVDRTKDGKPLYVCTTKQAP